MNSSRSNANAAMRSQMNSLRQAILDETARVAENRRNPDNPLNAPGHAPEPRESLLKPSVSGSMKEMRVSLKPSDTGTQSRSDDFAVLRDRLNNIGNGRLTGDDARFSGLMGGDMRLEEAIARINKANGVDRPPADPGPLPRSLTNREPDTPPVLSEPREQPPVPAQPAQRHVPAPPAPRAGPFPASAQPPAVEEHPAPENGYYYDEQGYYPPEGDAYGQPYPPYRVAEDDPRAGYGYAPDAGYEDWNGTGNLPAHTGYPDQREVWGQPPYAGAMLSPDATAAATDAFNRLADTLMERATNGARSMEDTTRELLRPILKSWLDEHLPRIVEQLVREEIQRVARRGGR